MLFTERIIQGMGGTGDTYACAVEMTRAWERADHFELFEDALPVLDDLRGRGLKLGLLSNTGRDLDVFVAHHGIAVDAILTSRIHGKTKPHETIFRAMLEKLDVAAESRGDGRRRSGRRHRRRACGRDGRVARRPRGTLPAASAEADGSSRASRGARSGRRSLSSRASP